jgi:Kef-type K+ transport system membrane component KefB/mannitol/fructose-specific phosphotransferase system IIA component (Ntr-type)
MESLQPREITTMFLALGTLLLSARILGEIARKLSLPSVIGEILAGIFLGPTVLGQLAPGLNKMLFPAQGNGALILDGLTTLAIALFLLVAGIEINLAMVWRRGRAALSVAFCGMLLPFGLGFAGAWWLPTLFGWQANTDHLAFSLFIATVLSISALPIIVKILMDLNIYRSELGVTMVAAAVLNDLLGWLVFAVILGQMGVIQGQGLPIGTTIGLVIGFSLIMLTLVPWVINHLLAFALAYTSGPGVVLGFALSFCLFSAAFTEWIGIHAIFGSFLAGVALGQSRHLREQTRTTIDQFISFIFAPLFFASIGLRVDFLAHFNLQLTLMLMGLAITGKVLGSSLGGHWGGLPKREVLAVGFGMSAQGTMGIILGVLALQIGLISSTVFVSLVVMALATSILSGPVLQRILHLKRPRRMIDYLAADAFFKKLKAGDREAVIRELSQRLGALAGLPPTTVADAVLAREQLMATGIGMGVAVPHARLDGLDRPLVAVGLAQQGVDFDAPDGIPVRIICMILAPLHDNGAQLEILADIAATFRTEGLSERALQSSSYTDFLALLRSSQH